MEKSLIDCCLVNWLGYGNPNGMVWFIGTEEAGAEFAGKNKTINHEESLQIRSQFKLAMDFPYVWEQLYHLPLESFKGRRVWHYMSVFLLNSENSQEIRNFIFNHKRLGTASSNHFMCELLPLPKPAKWDINPYKRFWGTIQEYHNDVLPMRIDLIIKNLSINPDVKLIVSYEELFLNELMKRNALQVLDEWNYNKENYCLFQWQISENRSLFLLSTPFFGQTRSKNLTLSYNGLKEAAIRTKRLIRNY